MVAGIYESGSIVWIPPSKCTKRDAEVQQSLKEKPTTLTVEQQTLKLAAGQMDQVLRADKELFTVMAQEHTGPFVNGPKRELPLDLILTRLMHDPRISVNLLPLPHHASRAAASSSVDGEPGRPGPKKIAQPKKKFKASAKAKANCPSELKGYNQFDDKGNPICWAFNMSSGCKEDTKDGRCKKGSHICINCKRANHSLVTCRVKKS
eukprot:s3875_g7.t1